ncbi:class I SAM-dependent methyltransferase [Actinoallomurus purpureus]|uniref:class I SAM-dependent methyltransferase n=1 Tax=Actinoallomurus purpureus TaxID=478114 RepID=UPI0020931BD8|nr:class I SAM-dependent methyltransferase [Actinoallomurus purpureus]MCO6011598.1 class I SAM-dependent methyltransferase [Actinoallomurus purpureus]
MSNVDLRRRRGDYGFDGDFRLIPAVWQATILGTICAAMAAFTVLNITAGRAVATVITGLITVWLLLTAVSYVYTTRVGKFKVWARVLAELGLRGDEDLLDLGCGRGAVLLAAAELLPTGRAVGIDLWRADQTGNSPEVTRRNAEMEGVAERVTLHSGDMTSLPFEDQSFDVVVSSLAIHNIPEAAGREAAIDEAARVLRPGGRILIADLRFTRKHLARLRSLGLTQTGRRNLGWRVWWGGPWFPTHLVTARSKQTVTVHHETAS